MKALKIKNQKTPKTVNVLFFSTFKSPSLLKEYKRKSETLSIAAGRKLEIKLVGAEAISHQLVEIKNENGCFYGLKRIKDQIIKKHININNVSQVIFSGSTLQIIYSVIW